MKTVRFELNFDEVIETVGSVDNSLEAFRGEDKAGKAFLLVDKLAGDKQVAICKTPAPEEGGYAKVEWFPIPDAAIIIDDDVKAEPTTKQVLEHLSDCFVELRNTITNVANDNYNHMAEYIGQEMDALKSEGCLGSGISEKTLLDALKIVTKNA